MAASGIYKRAYEGVNYRLRTVVGGRLASLCRPTSIALLLTERCNARCIHCDIWKNRGKEAAPTEEQWKAVLTDLRRWLGPVHVVLTGGEALLRPYALELVRHASSIGLFTELLTHGYWEDGSKFERLALARPWRITISMDGIGATHNLVRGRPDFFERSEANIQTLRRVREEKSLDFAIRLKTVVMDQNLTDLGEIARYAQRNNLEVFYQPIEQNYNTEEDARWFEHSPTWPKDAEKAVKAVRELLQLKAQGLPIANSIPQLEVMIPYFSDPAPLRVAVQSHSAHEGRSLCSALTMLQIQSNGDITVCTHRPPVGNIKDTDIRTLWECRPKWWQDNCCLNRQSVSLPLHDSSR